MCKSRSTFFHHSPTEMKTGSFGPFHCFIFTALVWRDDFRKRQLVYEGSTDPAPGEPAVCATLFAYVERSLIDLSNLVGGSSSTGPGYSWLHFNEHGITSALSSGISAAMSLSLM